MTTDTAALVRTWVIALAVAGFVAIWSVLARSPFPATTRTDPDAVATIAPIAAPMTTSDPQLAALDRREQALRARAVAVRRRHDVRWASYRRALGQRQALIRAIQTAPPITSSAPAPVFTTSPSSSAPAPAAATTRSS